MKAVWPGLFLSVAIAVFSFAVARQLPFISAVLLAVLTGMLLASTLHREPVLAVGTAFAARRLLRVGVVLLGVRLTFSDVAAIGVPAFVAVVAAMSIVALTTAVLARLCNVPVGLATLLGVGTAVCGNSAILATAPVIDARAKDVTFAVAVITVSGTVALVTFPLIAAMFNVSDTVFGFFAGIAINDTAQVVAAGAAYSPQALEVATVVKLLRNTLMAPLIVIIAIVQAFTSRRGVNTSETVFVSAVKAFPLFVAGFLGVVLLRSVGVIPVSVVAPLSFVSTGLITVAVAAVGLSTDVRTFRRIGFGSAVVGFGAALVLAVVGFVFALRLG